MNLNTEGLSQDLSWNFLITLEKRNARLDFARNPKQKIVINPYQT